MCMYVVVRAPRRVGLENGAVALGPAKAFGIVEALATSGIVREALLLLQVRCPRPAEAYELLHIEHVGRAAIAVEVLVDDAVGRAQLGAGPLALAKAHRGHGVPVVALIGAVVVLTRLRKFRERRRANLLADHEARLEGRHAVGTGERECAGLVDAGRARGEVEVLVVLDGVGAIWEERLGLAKACGWKIERPAPHGALVEVPTEAGKAGLFRGHPVVVLVAEGLEELTSCIMARCSQRGATESHGDDRDEEEATATRALFLLGALLAIPEQIARVSCDAERHVCCEAWATGEPPRKKEAVGACSLPSCRLTVRRVQTK